MKAAGVNVLAALGLAAVVAGAQQRPAVRPLGATVAKSSEPVTMVMGVRALPGGRLLVNDPMRRRVVLLDSALATIAVVADSTAATANAYSGRMGGLIPYRGDSTLFVDPQSMSMLVIDPAGKVGRVMSVPRSQDAMSLAGPAMGMPGFDAAGRLIYRSSNRFMMRGGAMAGGGGGGGAARTAPGAFTMPDQPDSAALVRIDLATRQLDTVAFVKVPKVKMRTTQDSAGRIQMMSEINPLPVVDEWAVLPDGSLAIIRGRDYHLDLVGADGKLTSAAKIPFDWQRLSDDDKIALIDSVKAARERMAAASHAAGGAATPAAGGGMGAGGPQQVTITMGGPGAPGGGGGGARGGAPSGPAQLHFVPPSELPDYKPPFFSGSVRVDADGNLWILTIPTKAIAGGPVYDVVNRKGELVERVQVPVGRLIIGFGSGGDVILMARDQTSAWLERARLR